jgi:N-acetylglucosamine kinase-like BadF-type ATPase
VIILSIDGGASHTRGVLFTEGGEVLHYSETEASSLNRPDADTVPILGNFVQDLADKSGYGLEKINLVNIGVAGVTNLDARERLFKEIDRLRLSERALVTSDVEAAYETVWGNDAGVLVCVGTGAIGWARDQEGNSYRASGRGPQLGGDPGSGYWMGKAAMVSLIMNEATEGDDLDALREKILETYNATTIEEAASIAGEGEDMVARTALLGGIICGLAAEGNDIALGILQEGTQGLADDLQEMIDTAELRSEKMTLGINGGIIVKNPVFRESLADAMSFDIPQITWREPEIDPAFGAGLIGARLKQIQIDLESLKMNWSKTHLRSHS